MRAPRWLPLFWLRGCCPVGWGQATIRPVIYDPHAGRRCGELIDGALHPVALTAAAHRGHLIVIGRLRLQILHANPENRLRMVPVEPNVTLRRLAQILGIRAVVHDAVMLVVSAWVGG